MPKFSSIIARVRDKRVIENHSRYKPLPATANVPPNDTPGLKLLPLIRQASRTLSTSMERKIKSCSTVRRQCKRTMKTRRSTYRRLSYGLTGVHGGSKNAFLGANNDIQDIIHDRIGHNQRPLPCLSCTTQAATSNHRFTSSEGSF
jgi:hypothetical protein